MYGKSQRKRRKKSHAVRKNHLSEKKAPVEKLSIERKPRWEGPQPFDTRCQPWQYVLVLCSWRYYLVRYLY